MSPILIPILVLEVFIIFRHIRVKQPYAPKKIDYFFFWMNVAISVFTLFDPTTRLLSLAFALNALFADWFRNLFPKAK